MEEHFILHSFRLLKYLPQKWSFLRRHQLIDGKVKLIYCKQDYLFSFISSKMYYLYLLIMAVNINRMSGVISIQGNLGAGKTTLLSLLNIKSIKQPVEQWSNINGINILKNYYENPKRWAFTFQLNAIHSRVRLWNDVIREKPGRLFYSQRSPQADRHVFGEIMYREGNLDKAEYRIYSDICSTVMKQCPLRAIIYLKCSPQLCLQRIKQRSRQGQQGITLDYLKKVHQRHQQWLQGLTNIPIFTIDTGAFDIYQKKDQQSIQNKINDFIHKLGKNNRSNDLESITPTPIPSDF